MKKKIRRRGLNKTYIVFTYLFVIMVFSACLADAAQQGCSFTGGAATAAGTISFNPIDPSQTGTLYGSVTAPVQFTCLSGTAYYTQPVAPLTFPSSGLFMSYGANQIPFNLDINVSGTSSSSTAVVDLLGSNSAWIDPAGYQDAVGGVQPSTGYSYTGTALQVEVCWGNCQGGKSITATINVDGVLANICKVVTPAGTLTFNMDPSITGTTTATISPDLSINCTKGDSVSISATSQNGGAAPQLKCSTPADCGSAQIPYVFTIGSSVTGAGFSGSGISLGINGSADSSQYLNAPYGTYSDLETITISY